MVLLRVFPAEVVIAPLSSGQKLRDENDKYGSSYNMMEVAAARHRKTIEVSDDLVSGYLKNTMESSLFMSIYIYLCLFVYLIWMILDDLVFYILYLCVFMLSTLGCKKCCTSSRRKRISDNENDVAATRRRN